MDVYSVGQCLLILQLALARDEVLQGSLTVRGEVSGWKVVRGHAYFSLKDPGGLIKSVYFSVPPSLAGKIAEGNVVDATGQFKIYAERGELQFYVRTIRLQSAAGLLQLRFEELKTRLNREGVIPKPPEEKRQLPRFPRRIGVVASRSSAAFADIGDMSDLKDVGGSAVSTGSGLYVVLIGSLLGIAGNVVAIAKRRR